MLDFQKLSYDEFEKIVGILLQYEGHRIIRGPGVYGRVSGPDYETIDPDGKSIIVEVKHYSNARMPGKSDILQFAGDIDRYRQQNPDARGLLIISSASPIQSPISEILDSRAINVWGAVEIQTRLAKHPEIASTIQDIIDGKVSAESRLQALTKTPSSSTSSPAGSSPGGTLRESLKNLPCGRGAWREYERSGAAILTRIFNPELGVPEIQERSDDDLDIMDAIFPIRSSQAPWSLVRSEYKTRFVVAEFKNFCEPINQRQVESIAQYLWNIGKRNFGLLVSRLEPSESAIAQRRREWIKDGKMIVFLSDEDLFEMLDLRAANGQPFDVIDRQLEDFLRTLTP